MGSRFKKILVLLIVLAIGAALIMLMFNNKKKTEEKAASAVIQTVFPVSVIIAEKEKIEENLSMVGTTYPNREVNLLSETSGRIVDLRIDVGSRIGKDAIIAVVDDEIKQATYNNALASFEKAEKDLERYKQLLNERSANDAQYEAALLNYKVTLAQKTIAERQLKDTKIKSPISGIITSKNIEIGTVLSSGTSICNIVDVSQLKVKVNVAENDAFRLKEGDKVTIKSDIYSDKDFEGIVKTINIKGDEAHTYPIEIMLKNTAQSSFKAGMFVKVIFNDLIHEEAIVIPREAIVGSTKKPQVYVVNNSKVSLKDVLIGVDMGKKVEITQGLSVGDSVVVNGQLNLVDGVNVQVVK